MKYIYLLSGENLDLAKEEVLALTNAKHEFLDENVLVLDKFNKIMERLAYTKKIYRYLFESEHHNLINHLKNFKWNKIYKQDFCIRIVNPHHKRISYEERHLASYIWYNVKKPEVNLKDAKTQIELIHLKDKIFCGLLLWENREKFGLRKPHLRPGFHPSSLNPKLARAAVNLLGANCKQLIDPFCGTGGILIEAGLMGLKVIGYDIDENMLKKCAKNLTHFKIKNFKLIKQDTTNIRDHGNIDYVATDLPYGKNTRLTDVNNLYSIFLLNLKKVLKKKAVIIFPDFIASQRMIKKAKLKILKKFNYYIHKSLTKRVYLISK